MHANLRYKNRAYMSVQTDVQESPTDLIMISVAQRYSVLVTARNDTSSNWAIHANMDEEMFDDVPPELQLSELSHLE